MWNISDNYSRRWLGRHWEKKHYVCGAFNFSLPLHFFTSLSCEAKLIFHFSLWSESCLPPPSHSTPFPLPVLHPSYSLRLAFKLTLSWYSDIPPFRFGIAVNRVCEMEMRSLSLPLFLPPSLSRHQNEAMPPMFFSDLGVPPNLISGAEREKERGGGRDEQNAEEEEGVQDKGKRWKERRMKNEQGNEATCEMRTGAGLIQEHLSFFLY